MARLAAPLAAATLVAAGCASAVPLSQADQARLSTLPSVPVLYVRASPPWVDCENDEGQKVWEFPGSALDGAVAPPLRIAGGGPPVVGAGNIWQAIEDQWTEPLRSPPVDPATATAAALVARAREAGVPFPLSVPREIHDASPATLRSEGGGGPVLVVEIPRFVLAGCFFTYQPWFTARAAILRTGDGTVAWRQTCEGTFPDPARPPPSSRDELLAGDGALYRRVLEERAAGCAAVLVSALPGGTPR